MKRNLLLLAVLLSFSSYLQSAVFQVTSTTGNGWWPTCGGPGSLLEALCQASTNPGRDTIVFNLPGGTTISSDKNPFTLSSTDNNLLINGLSTQDGQPIKFNFSVTITGSLIDIRGVIFETVNHSLTISGNNNVVDNCTFRVTGTGQNALWLNGGNNSIVRNCTFNSSTLHAVSIENGGNHLVENCTVLNSNDVGIIVRGSGNNTIRKCNVSNGNHNGIGLISGSNIIEYCETHNNARAGIVADNTLGGCTDNIIRNNKVYNNNLNYWLNAEFRPTPDQGGIQSNGPRTIINNNWVYGNAGNGILVNKLANVSGASNSEIKNNVIGRDSLGNENGNQWNGVFVWECNNVVVENNIVVNNGGGSSHNSFSMPDRVSGIRFQQVTSGSILTNFVGTDITKKVVGNAFDGITLHTNVSNVSVIGNTINNNGFNSTYGSGGGIALRNTANNNIIRSNFIGMYADSTDGGNNDYGIAIEVGTGNIIGGDNPLQGNVIANSKNAAGRGVGIWLVLLGNSNNSVFNNLITNNVNDGVLIERGARNNIIGNPTRGNIISNNKNGILVKRGLEWDNSRGATTFGNNFRSNSFVCNTNQGILLTDEGNNLYGKPNNVKTVIVETNESRPNFVSGYAPSANAIVDIYVKDTLCRVDCDNNTSQGAVYVTSVTAATSASTNGLFMWEFDLTSPSNVGNIVRKSNVIVMATQAGSNPVPNSSEFSTCTPEITCVTPTNVTITGNNNVCTGGNSTLTANADAITVGEDYVYTWYRGSILPANIIATNTNQNTIIVNTSGNYFVVIANTIDSAACSDVNATPFAFNVAQTPTDVNITGDNSVCTGQNSILTANGTIDNTVTNNYAWYRTSVSPGNLIVGANNSTLTATQSGTYFVVVSNSTNTTCRDTNNTPFSLTVNQTPSNTAINGTDNVCTGQSSTLTATATLDNNVTNTYAWYRTSVTPANLIPNNTTNTLSVNQSGNYFVVITNSADNTCRDTVNSPFTFTVSQTPTDVNITGDNSVCTGQNSILNANGTTDNTVTNNYAWYRTSVSPGNLIVGANNSTLTATQSGTYFVVVSNSTNTTCRDTNNTPFSLTVNQTPSNTAINGSDNVCTGQSSTLTATATLDNNVTNTYAWYRTSVTPANLIPNNTTNTLSVNQSGNYYVVITNSADNTCRDTINSPFTFTVSQTPTDVDITGDNSVCTGQNSILTANATIDNNVSNTYAWYRNSVAPGNIINGANTNTLTASQSGSYFVVITNSANTACTGTNNIPFTLTVNQTPSNTNITGDNNICSGESATLTATATLDNNVTNTYTWYRTSVIPGNLISTNNNNTLSVNQSGTYYVVVTNSADNTCRDTVNSPFSFTVNVTPTNTSITGDNAACTGESKVLTAIADIDNSITNTYAWYRGSVSAGDLIIESNSNTLSVDEAGTYFVVVINGNNTDCRDTINNPFTFDINPIPAVEILQNDTVICVRRNQTVDVTVTTTAVNPTIVWSNGQATNQLTNIVAQAPVYLVATVTDANNCSDTAGIRIGVECPPFDTNLPNVFVPNGGNPRNTVFTPITNPGEVLEGNILKSHLEIYNRWGVKMFETDALVPVWDGKFNGRAVPAGTYFWIWKYTDISDASYNKNGFVQALDAN